MQDQKKMLKTAKKTDLCAKGELGFTAGSQGQAKKDQQAKIIQSASLKGSNSTNTDAALHRNIKDQHS